MKGSFRHFEHYKKFDLIGLGNAIVDIIVNIEDKFLEINNLDKGSMNLINFDESQRLLQNCKVIKQISGGSSANTVVCLAELMEVPIAIVSLGANRDQTIVIEDPIHGPKRALLR